MRIRSTEPAVRDLTSICDYLDRCAEPAISQRVAARVYRTAASLDKSPLRGRPGRTPGTRELVCNHLPYIIVYRVRENTTEIARVMHGAQDWP